MITLGSGEVYGKPSTNLAQFMPLEFQELERKYWAIFLTANKKAKRLPARVAKKLYGKAKKPFTIIHDCIIDNRVYYEREG